MVTVNANGQTTALANGTTLVYANLAEDTVYKSASAQLKVTISDLNDVWHMDTNGNWQKGFQSSIKLHKATPVVTPIQL